MTKEEFEFNKKQQYAVTEEDIMEATATIMSAEEGPIAELLKTSPSIALLVPIITIDLWKKIIEKKQAEAQDQVTNMMAAILGSNIDKEDK